MQDELDTFSQDDDSPVDLSGLEGFVFSVPAPSPHALPWRLGDCGRAGALNADQINHLSSCFDIEVDGLLRLSMRLGGALASVPSTMQQVDEVASMKKGKEVASAALSAIRHARRLLDDAASQSHSLSPRWDLSDEDQIFVEQSTDILWQVTEAVADLENRYSRLVGPEHLAVAYQFYESRRLVDERRQRVLGQIFFFWQELGRKLTFTTDPITSKRRGVIFSFVNAVVACVTDPCEQLGDETIVKELRNWKQHAAAIDSVTQHLKESF